MSNVKLNLNQRAYGSIETAIGRLFVFAMTGGDVIELERELGGDWSKVVPDVLIRAFILHTCFLETQLVDENTKPKGVKIEYELIEKLTKADLDNISKMYIENNSYLYRGVVLTTTRDGNKSLVAFDEGENEHLQMEGESFSNYLARLLRAEHEGFASQYKSMKDLFSTDLSEKMMDLSRSAQKAMHVNPVFMNGGVNSFMRKAVAERYVEGEDFVKKIESYNKIEQDNKMKPFLMLGDKLIEVVKASNQQVDKLDRLTEVQLESAFETKKSSDNASKYTQRTIWLTIIGVVVSIFLWLIGYAVDYKDGKELNSTIEDLNETGKNISSKIDQSRIEQVMLQKQVDEQHQEMSKLSLIILNQKREIERLKSQVRVKSTIK